MKTTMDLRVELSHVDLPWKWILMVEVSSREPQSNNLVGVLDDKVLKQHWYSVVISKQPVVEAILVMSAIERAKVKDHGHHHVGD